MQVGIVGEPQSGKSTLLALLLAGEGARRGKAPFDAVVSIPDPRLTWLAQLYRPRKLTPATLDFADLGGDPRCAGLDLSGLLALPQARTCDALALVLPRFATRAERNGGAGDLEEFELATALADLELVERRLARIAADRKKGLKDAVSQAPLLARLCAHLEQQQPLRSLELHPEEQRQLRGYQFLSLKPVVVLANLADAAAGQPPPAVLTDPCARARHELCACALPIETELAHLDESERAAFLEHLGLTEPARDRFLRATYASLGLISFLTVGPDECRAWTVQGGTSAPAAAGCIHSDLERGFIRAEVVPYDDLRRHGDMKAARAAGAVRLEGKDYIVADGDVIEFRFSV
jgi:GTP-binding protein YchF